MKLAADIDEYYLTRVRAGPERDGGYRWKAEATVTVRRVSPQVRNGQFSIDLEFDGREPCEPGGRRDQRRDACSSVAIRRR